MEMDKNINMARVPQMWSGSGKTTKNITLCVTEDCNLACKYCYMLHKNSRNIMDLATAQKAVDFFLDRTDEFPEENVVWDFIGGEPFLEIDLIDKVCDYIKLQQFKKNHKWFKNYRFSFSTNGMNYTSKKVQDFIRKNHKHLSIGISMDGNKVKHDNQRVKLDGSGSYEDVLKAIPLWQEQFPDSPTKATFAHDDLIHLKDSIVSLWNIGIKEVAANIVFEDVWEEGDVIIFENQLTMLADYIIENELWWDYNVRFFDPNIGYKSTSEDLKRNFCGAGKMITVNTEGRLYTCIRYLDFALNNAQGYSIGDIETGINYDLLRPFSKLNKENVSDRECIECEVGEGCPYCSAFNYDDCNGKTIFHRTKYHCEMYKANVRVNKYFWNKLEVLKGIENPRKDAHFNKKIVLINDSDMLPHCNYKWNDYNLETINHEKYQEIIGYCIKNSIDVINLGNPPNNQLDRIVISTEKDSIGRLYSSISDRANPLMKNFIVNVTKDNVSDLTDVCELLVKDELNCRVNVNIIDLIDWKVSDLTCYGESLKELMMFCYEKCKESVGLYINVLTDSWNDNVDYSCKCGSEHLAVTQNGDVYLCPGFVSEKSTKLGYYSDLTDIFEKQKKMSRKGYCEDCEVVHCKQCSYISKLSTGELYIPPDMLCQVSKLEYQYSMKLKNMLDKGVVNGTIS